MSSTTPESTEHGASVAPPHGDASLSAGVQRYLMAIVGAQHDETATTSAVAREIGCSAPSASEMLHRLADGGLLHQQPITRAWKLTPLGRREVAAIRRRQSVLERYLRVALEFDAADAAREAAQLGPSVSLALERRLRDAVWPVARPCQTDEQGQ